jgi:glycosyltransferase involved in cell wall biosynthesis
VLDFRDAWVDNPRRLWTGSRQRRLERTLVENSALVTVATDWIRDRLLQRYSESGSVRIETLTNAYDPLEFPEPDVSLRERERLVVTYTGTFNDALPPSPYDRSPYYLVEALSRIKPEHRGRLRVRIVGDLGPVYRRWISDRNLTDVVDVIGPVSHRRALQYQQAADVLLLIISSSQTSAGDLTGKLLEYVGARRPVLALVPQGEANEFIRDRRLGWVTPPEDVELIAARLRELVSMWRAGALPTMDSETPQLSAGQLVKRLADLLDSACRDGTGRSRERSGP